MAEEQLSALNAYMAKATNAYQTEIMRLRKALFQGQGAKALAHSDVTVPGLLSSPSGKHRSSPAGRLSPSQSGMER